MSSRGDRSNRSIRYGAILFVGFVLLLGGATGAVSAEQSCTVSVHPTDDLQSTIDDASPGETICLESGTYEVEALSIDTDDLTLTAADPDDPPTLDGLNYSTAGIHVEANNVSIAHLAFERYDTAIWLERAEDVTLTKLETRGGSYGVYLSDSAGAITSSTFQNHTVAGVSVWNWDDLTFEWNILFGNEVGLRLWEGADDDSTFEITTNRVNENVHGIDVRDISESQLNGIHLEQNGFSANDVGLRYHGSETGLDARDNWWGHQTGPSGGVSDPVEGTVADGDGDPVDADIRFDPWLETGAGIPVGDADVSVSVDWVSTPVTETHPLTVLVELENQGTAADERTVTLLDVADRVVDSTEVELDPGESTLVMLSWVPEQGEAGTGTIAVETEDDSASHPVTVESIDPEDVIDFVCDVTVDAGDSIQDALDAASPGDTICIAPGEFEESLTITTDDVNLVAETPADPPRIMSETDEPTVSIAGPSGVSLHGLDLYKPFAASDGAVLDVRDSDDVNIWDTRIESSGSNSDGLVITASSDVTVRSNVVTTTDQTGVLVDEQSTDVNILDNLVTATTFTAGIDGVVIRDETQNVTVQDNAIRHSDRGLLVADTSSISITGNDLNEMERAAIEVDNTTDVAVEENEIESAGTGIRVRAIDDDTLERAPHLVTIERNTVRHSHDGITATDALRLGVYDNTIESIRNQGMTLEDVRLLTVENNTVQHVENSALSITDASRPIVTDNVFDRSHHERTTREEPPAVRLVQLDNGWIETNVVNTTSGDGIRVTNDGFSVVRENTIRSTERPDEDVVAFEHGHGIHVVDSNLTQINVNDIEEISKQGIQLTETTNAKVLNNTVDRTGLAPTPSMDHDEGAGIGLYRSPDTEVARNVVEQSEHAGIFLNHSPDGLVTENRVQDPRNRSDRGSGIRLHTADRTIVDGNDVRDNVGNVLLTDTADAVVSNNTARGSTRLPSIRVGFLDSASANVTVEHNNVSAITAIRLNGSEHTVRHNEITIIGSGITASGEGHRILDNEIVGAEALGEDGARHRSEYGVRLVDVNETLIQDNRIVRAQEAGIDIVDSAGAEIRSNTLSANHWGVIARGTVPETVLRDNAIVGNYHGFLEWGVDDEVFRGSGVNATAANYTVDARQNWWGNVTGPSTNGSPVTIDPVTGVPAEGHGDAVTRHVRFDPWTPNVTVAIEAVTTPVDESDPLTVTANVTNTGAIELDRTVTLRDGDGTERDAVDLVLRPGDAVTATLVWDTEPGDAGIHELTVATDAAVERPYTNDVDEAATTSVRVLDPDIDEGTLAGTVTDEDGSPIDNATLEVLDDDTVLATASTDADGAFAFLVDAGTWDLRVSAAGYESHTVSITVEADDTIHQDVELETASTTGKLTGTVTDDDGEPIEFAAVRLLDGDTFVETDITDADGTYALSAEADTYDVLVEHDVFEDEVVEDVEIVAMETATLDVTLDADDVTATINGVVTDGDSGEPLADATVWVTADGDAPVAETLTDENGFYELTVDPGTYDLLADAPGYLPMTLDDLSLDPGEERGENLPLVPETIDQPGVIEGTVMDADDGTPIAGATVTAIDADGVPANQTTTDADGTYAMVVDAGVYDVAADADGYVDRTEIDVEVSENAVTAVDLDLEADAGTLPATVQHVDGTAPDMDAISIDAFVADGQVQIQLVNDTAPAGPDGLATREDLGGLNADASTVFKLEVTVPDDEPLMLVGTGDVHEWNVTEAPDGAYTLTATVSPIAQQLIVDCDTWDDGCVPSLADWPDGEDDQATVATDATVALTAPAFPDLDADARSELAGTSVGTDAQAFGTPVYVPAADALSLFVAGPNETVAGEPNDGVYEVFLPDTLLAAWNVTDPATELTAAFAGQPADVEANAVDDGARLAVNLCYSAGEVTIAAADPGIAVYADEDGTIDTDGLRAAVDDWRGGELETELLRDVVDAWRSGETVG